MKKKAWKLSAKMLVVYLIRLASMVNIPEASAEVSKLETYIVFVKKPEEFISSEVEGLDSWYRSFLPVTTSGSDEQRLVYACRNVVTGFAAKLTAEEAKAMEKKKEGFVFACLEKSLPLHTTRAPSFLGLQQSTGLWKDSNYGKGVIIGLLDCGISPDHPSFRDEGMSPPPKKWKGRCELKGATCNNKLIGARNFVLGDEAPLDQNGHGTHTASTAAGSPVRGANFYGELNGTASGIAPLAHVAMYKACNERCKDSAILAAMDAAVEDGVDVLSLSLGGRLRPFYGDAIAIGAYGASQKGVFVSCSAGNSGPHDQSLGNEAPWILTVGASTVDREIRAIVLLGNKTIDGQSLFQPKDFPPTPLPLVYPGVDLNLGPGKCQPGSLKEFDIKGKIVLCQGGGWVGGGDAAKGQEVKNSGGAATILMNDFHFGYVTKAVAYVLPASDVSYEAGLAIQAYINSSSSPTASIVFKRTVYHLPKAPQVASFSSRGPSLASPGIVKPDVIGPCSSILAAWPIFVDSSTNLPATFNVISGTSMACPYLSGIAALLKSTHPEWSPAAIKSAIMTTTDILNLGGKSISDQRYAQQLVSAGVSVWEQAM